MKRFGIGVVAIGCLLAICWIWLPSSPAVPALAAADPAIPRPGAKLSTSAPLRAPVVTARRHAESGLHQSLRVVASDNAQANVAEFLVVDETSAAVADAGIAVWADGGVGARRRARTNVRGRAVLHAQAGNQVEVLAEGYAPHMSSLGAQPWAQPMRIVLRRGIVVLRAVIVDDVGAPLAGAKVALKTPTTTLTGRSDAQGSVAFLAAHPLEGALETLVRIEHRDACWPLQGVPIPVRFGVDGVRTIRAFRRAVLHVECLGPDSERLENVSFRLTHAEAAGDPFANVTPDSPDVTRGGLGNGSPHFELLAPPMVDLTLWVEHRSYRRAAIQLAALNPTEVRYVVHRFREVDLHPTIEVHLVDSKQRPLPGRLTVSTVTSSHVYPTLTARAVSFPRPEADWVLLASAPGHASVESRFSAATPPSSPLMVELGAAPPKLEVHVTTGGGQAAHGTVVHAFRETVHDTALSAGVARANEQGIAAFEGLVSGRYRVTIGHGRPGQYSLERSTPLVPYPASAFELRPGDRTAIRLVDPSSIQGVVVDAKGRSLVCSWVDPTAPNRPPLFTESVAPASDGSFRIAGLPAGNYVLWPSDGSHRNPVQEVDLGVAEALTGLEVSFAN